jgi:hypothetical protein
MSHNVIAKITGSKYPDEYVIYSAHWDHLGIGKPDAKETPFIMEQPITPAAQPPCCRSPGPSKACRKSRNGRLSFCP